MIAGLGARGVAEFGGAMSFGCVEEAILITGLAVATFVSTSVDNLFLLVGFLTSPGFRARNAIVGYTGAVVLVLLAGLAASYAADFAPGRYAGYLGVVPVAMGLTRLYKVVRQGDSLESVTQPLARGALSVGLVMLANSGDSLAAFVALFAETREPLTFLIVAVGAALSLAWCGLAVWMTGHVFLQRLLQRWGRYLLPVLLIVVGVYILADTRTDTLAAAPVERGTSVPSATTTSVLTLPVNPSAAHRVGESAVAPLMGSYRMSWGPSGEGLGSW